MATTTTTTTQDSAFPPEEPPQQPQPQPPQQQRLGFTLPSYPEMILGAIETVNAKAGASKTAISKQIESSYPDLTPAHATLLSHHLNRMKQSGQLLFVKNNYLVPDANAPPRRGRGRPPKPKDPNAPPPVVSPPRPRGRPPKPRDPNAPPKVKSPPGGSGRPRGRPPKKPKTEVSAVAAEAGPPRGRGRPPKIKPAVAPVAG